MKSLPNYSVLMSVYVKEKPGFLRESMMSMFEQTVPTNDFVLICDGPLNDGLDKVISEMQEKFGEALRVFRLSENRGLGLALRFGVEKCKNELIARMDSDDVAVKDRCEKELGVFEKMDVDVVGSNITEYDEKMEKALGVRKVPESDAEIKKYAKRRNPVNHMSVMFKKTKVLEAGNYLDMPGFEDYYLWARMMKNKCRFCNVQESLMQVRGGNEMVRRRGGTKYLKNIVCFQNVLRENRIIATPRLLVNIVERSAAALIPSGARSVIYTKVLRRAR